MAPIDPNRYRFLSAAMHDVRLWWRAAMDAYERLEASEQVHDYQGALIAAAETLPAVALIRAWVIAVLPQCDDELRQQFEMFERDHPEVRVARNVHEHAEDYDRGKGKDKRLTGVVHYERVQTHPVTGTTSSRRMAHAPIGVSLSSASRRPLLVTILSG